MDNPASFSSAAKRCAKDPSKTETSINGCPHSLLELSRLTEVLESIKLKEDLDDVFGTRYVRINVVYKSNEIYIAANIISFGSMTEIRQILSADFTNHSLFLPENS